MIFRNLNHNLKIRLLTSFLQNSIMFSIIPFMSLYLSAYMGVIAAGLYLIIAVVVNFLASLIGGHISDVFSKKGIILTNSYVNVLVFLSMTICIYTEQRLVTLFSILFICSQLIYGIMKPAQDAITIESITEETRREYSVIQYWINNLSMALGITIGGAVYNNYKSELFITATAILLINSIIIKLFLQDININKIHKSNESFLINTLNSYKEVYKDKPYVNLVLGLAFVMMAELSMSSYIVVRLKEDFTTVGFYGFSIDGVKLYSILMIINTFIVISMTFVFSRISQKMSPNQSITIGVLLYISGYSVMVISSNIYILIVSMVIATIGELLYAPAYNSERIRIIPIDKRGAYSAVAGFSNKIGNMLSKSALIISAVLAPNFIALYIFLTGIIGLFLISNSLFNNKNINYLENDQTFL
ncbi:MULTISPECIES: MFS transporter [Bacillus cereus group]|uniref:Major facilitator superfamily MFS_1 n=1 Tax=Bacillus cytotoxicus (strain DSM 22905 / CIP 110041 / 391-98 / NVH 391-98) TaxID=315749 RepID=A7GK77_BACCN|nr:MULTISPECIES: MFS transporter [Bacillus cereus group]ABS20535.1 major facilitator superfamily MFS_1 [Bacillus cytotoxicus NVH 391-98]AWC43280.1 MFS transporter [Bacillus cytotoxicus]MDH2865597.1 MFS transporter [Bacillus cytotoxicus]MDH2882526.1 MFS transporter [Bacillus cytotoxicus]MDH2885612.1 MFS transporter [Bacillus cytotoxicus]